MPIEPMRLSPHELSLLQALDSGRRPSITSSHRTRLELLGLVRDGPAGLRLTPEGRRCAYQMAAKAEPGRLARSKETISVPRDAQGRRKRSRRTLPI